MITTRAFPLPPADRREVLRYAGVQVEAPELSALLDSVLSEALPLPDGMVCWTELPVTCNGAMVSLGPMQAHSEALAAHLRGCCRAVVFAATLGIGPDRLIARYSRISPARALMLQALGAERIEALCNTFCHQLRQSAAPSGLQPLPRFSPGYGDLPLELQRDIFRILDCPRRIGLTLNESLLMSPSKSVTAIVGLRARAGDAHPHHCAACGKTDCLYRRSP